MFLSQMKLGMVVNEKKIKTVNMHPLFYPLSKKLSPTWGAVYLMALQYSLLRSLENDINQTL